MLVALTTNIWGEESKYPTIEPPAVSEYYNVKYDCAFYYLCNTKQWLDIYIHEGNAENYAVAIIGDSIVEGVTYAKVVAGLYKYDYMYDDTSEFLCARQEGDKVFLLRDDKSEQLVIDYSLEIGDKIDLGDNTVLTVVDKGFYDGIVTAIPKYKDELPKMLKLSDGKGHEDIWVEGIGSLTYGIIPWSFLSKCKWVENKEVPSYRAVLVSAYTEENLKYMERDDELYHMKAARIRGGREEYESRGEFTEFTFNDNILHFIQVRDLECQPTFEQLISQGDNTFFYRYFQFKNGMDTDCASYRYLTAEFKGFEPGTYTFVTYSYERGPWPIIATNDPAGIDDIMATSVDKEKAYDLSGKKHNGNGQSVIISNGKKYIGK